MREEKTREERTREDERGEEQRREERRGAEKRRSRHGHDDVHRALLDEVHHPSRVTCTMYIAIQRLIDRNSAINK